MKTPLSLLGYLGLVRVCLGKCYFPNGREATSASPCDSSTDASVCCDSGPLGSACLSNKLCKSPDGKVFRGSCTDQGWMSQECPYFCLNTEGAVQDLVSCSNVTGSDTSYCCAGAVNCCDGGVGRFNILPSKPQTWAMWDASSAEYLVVTPLARTGSASRTAVATSATPTPDASGRTRSLTTASQTPAQTGTAPGQSEGSQGSTPSGGLSQGAQAGIGVGAAVGVLLISAVGYLWWKLKRTKKMVEGSQGQGGPKDSPNPAQLPTPFDMAQLPTRSDYTGYDQAKAELPAEQGVYHYGKAELPTAQGVFELQAATTPTYPSRRDSATVPGLS